MPAPCCTHLGTTAAGTAAGEPFTGPQLSPPLQASPQPGDAVHQRVKAAAVMRLPSSSARCTRMERCTSCRLTSPRKGEGSHSQGSCPIGVVGRRFRNPTHGGESMLQGSSLRVRARTSLQPGKGDKQPHPWGEVVVPWSGEKAHPGLPCQWLHRDVPCGETTSPTETCPF